MRAIPLFFIIFSVIFPSWGEQGSLVVKDIHISGNEKLTMLSLDLNEGYFFDVFPSEDKKEVAIKIPPQATWKAPENGRLKKSLVNAYDFWEKGTEKRLILKIQAGTSIHKKFIRYTSEGQASFNILFADKSFKAEIPEVYYVPHLQVRDTEHETYDDKKIQVDVIDDQKVHRLMDKTKWNFLQKRVESLVHSISITPSEKATTLTISTRIPVKYGVVRDKHNNLRIQFPKETNWFYIDTFQKSGGVIKRYYIDNSSKHSSDLVLVLNENAELVRETLWPPEPGLSAAFMLVLM